MSCTQESRYAVVLVHHPSNRPIGLLIYGSSQQHARSFTRHFNRRIRRSWPDRRAQIIPMI